MKKTDTFLDGLDPEIRPAVEILNKHGFKTIESCQGGEGHCFSEPTVCFEGSEFDLIRAYEICEQYNLCLLEGHRVYRKTPFHDSDETTEIGITWREPFNEIVFLKHSKTGTIFRPH